MFTKWLNLAAEAHVQDSDVVSVAAEASSRLRKPSCSPLVARRAARREKISIWAWLAPKSLPWGWGRWGAPD